MPSDITLDELHEVVQDVMGWSDCHLHVFTASVKGDLRDYMPEEHCQCDAVSEEDITLAEIAPERKAIKYEYDFGDSWKHLIVVEETDYYDTEKPYPIYCIEGERACPPEDCGGPYGYNELLSGFRNDDKGSILQLGRRFDPDYFHPNDVNKRYRVPPFSRELPVGGIRNVGKKSKAKKIVEKLPTRFASTRPLLLKRNIPELVSHETVKQALLSPLEAVRQDASKYFTRTDPVELDSTVMQMVIQSVERYGMKSSLTVLEDIHIPQDAETIRWVTNEMAKPYNPDCALECNYRWMLADILCKANPALLKPEISEGLGFPVEKRAEFKKRLELANTDWDMLIAEYRSEVLREWKDTDDDHTEILTCEPLEFVLEALSRHVERTPEILNSLRKYHAGEITDRDWYRTLCVILAGRMRIGEALPIIADWVESEYVNDEEQFSAFGSHCLDTLEAICDEETLGRFYTLWRKEPDDYAFVTEILSNMNTHWALEYCLDMAHHAFIENHDDVIENVTDQLLDRYVKESYLLINELDQLRAPFYDPSEIRQHILVANFVNPAPELPDQKAWLNEAEKNRWNLDDDHERFRAEPFYLDFQGDDDLWSDGDEEDDFMDGDFDDDPEYGIPLHDLPQIHETMKGFFRLPDPEDDFDDESIQPIRTKGAKVGRNDPCPCGSGKKYKKCCLK